MAEREQPPEPSTTPLPEPTSPEPASGEPAAGQPHAGEPAPAATTAEQQADTREDGLGRTRTSAAWTWSVVAMVVLLLLLIFILQNGKDVQVSYLGMSGELPLGVALLFAALGGGLLVVLVGTARILQLRRVARRSRRRDRDA
ncbi:MAG: lipopolysaccharide assembly protein LapA domain-containing protein [Actinomycetes bacterium]